MEPTLEFAPFSGFSPDTTTFLSELAAHNNREWFQDNKARYEDQVRDPALAFIAAMAQPLSGLSAHFTAVPKKTGGSLMRVHRDTRFSKDKVPYKTNIGIQFRHERGKDVHAPGYYFHIDPEQVFIGAGVWHPDGSALGKIRDAIAADPQGWQTARASISGWHLEGDRLKRAPKGYDPDHPMIEDLKRKDFIGITDLTHADLSRPELLDKVSAAYKQATPLMRFLCGALELKF